MNEQRKPVRSRLLFMIVSVITVAPFAVGALIGAEREGEDSLYKQLSVLSEVLTLIQRTYVDETSIRGLLDGALEGATDALDPMSTFVPADESRSYADTRAIGSSRSGLTVARDRGVAYVVAVADGSPGEAAGVMNGDVISAVNERSTRNMPLWSLEGTLAGAPGTQLELELLRNGQSLNVGLVLDSYPEPRPELVRREEIAVLRISNVDRQAVGPVRDILASISGEDRLIVDLRGVAGGDAEAAYSLGGLFATGRLGVLTARDSEIRSFDNDLPALWQGNAVVVVDSGTQGPAEILAAVLKQSLPATLVGQPTFGLAGRRGVIELPSGGQVVMTDALFSGPDGEPIDERLRPDELVRESLRPASGEEVSLDDLMLERAVEVLARGERKAA
jgi:carboxyl-terminal processing protease